MIHRFSHFWRRNTVSIAVVIIMLGFGTMLFLQAVATSRIEATQQTTQAILKQEKGVIAQLDANTKNISSNATLRTDQINTLTNRLDCIFYFFSSQNPDRAQKAIADINTCTITSSNGNSPVTVNPNPSFPSSVQSTPSQTTPSSGGTSNKTTTSGGVGSTTQPSTPSSPAPTITPKTGFVTQVVNQIKSVLNGL